MCNRKLARDPEAVWYRATLALYACLCGQWRTADEQIRILGDRPESLGKFKDQAEYDRLKREAAGRVPAVREY